jgi:phosphoenolpyruvate carboxykinase (ATP)
METSMRLLATPRGLELDLDFTRRAVERLRVEPSAAELVRISVESGQCTKARSGALIFRSGKLTGRAASDRYIVQDETTKEHVAWGSLNRPISPEQFRALRMHLSEHVAGRDAYFLTRHAGGPEGIGLRVVTTSPVHALISRHLFQEPREKRGGEQLLTILHSPDCFAIPETHGVRSGTFIVIDISSRTILIGGTGYAGELKKSVFSYLNFVLPARGILPMHAAVNVGDWGDSAVFFGLSGTGKTTLSTDPERHLLGDDEHGWSDTGLFNLEGGCYAKTLSLSATDEPDIWRAVNTPLAVLENVVVESDNETIAWNDASITENTRGAYPLSALSRVWPMPMVRAPEHVIFLTADAFGVLPPVARLSMDQAAYHFLSGYTSKIAGTEAGSKEPQPTFSACFGAPFMPLSATRYAELLRQRLQESGARVWLVNTGWVGGGYGEGQRMPVHETRLIIRAILSSSLELGPTRVDPYFGLAVPIHVSGVRPSILDPRTSWKDVNLYDAQARRLVRRFQENLPP